MLTVKLVRNPNSCYPRTAVMKLVEAEEVNIYPAGPAAGMADNPKERTNEVRGVAVDFGQYNAAFYIADTSKSLPKGWCEEQEFYDIAYIENSAGATVEIVRPY